MSEEHDPSDLLREAKVTAYQQYPSRFSTKQPNRGDRNTMENLTPVTPAGTDFEIAARLKANMQEALVRVLSIMDEANKSGFVLGFNLARDANTGKNFIAMVTCSKFF